VDFQLVADAADQDRLLAMVAANPVAEDNPTFRLSDDPTTIGGAKARVDDVGRRRPGRGDYGDGPAAGGRQYAHSTER
jgi:hypothetical protein